MFQDSPPVNSTGFGEAVPFCHTPRVGRQVVELYGERSAPSGLRQPGGYCRTTMRARHAELPAASNALMVMVLLP